MAETDHVLGHELVHGFQYDLSRRRDRGGTVVALGALPLWLVEGMAEYLSLGPIDAHTAMWVREASFREQMPSLRQLDHPRFSPYRYGHAFWAYVAGRWGDRAVGELFRAALASSSAEVAIRGVLDLDAEGTPRTHPAATRIRPRRPDGTGERVPRRHGGGAFAPPHHEHLHEHGRAHERQRGLR